MSRELPKAIKSEQAILGAMISIPKINDDVIEKLKVKDFYVSKHTIIYDELINLYNDGVKSDLPSITQSLNLKGKLMDAGGASYLSELMEGATLGENINYHITIIKDMAKRRELITYAREVAICSYDTKNNSKDIINTAADNLYKLVEVNGGLYNMNECVVASLEEIENRMKLGGGVVGKGTGFKKLDKALGGLNEGDLMFIAARPSMGKTAFVLNIASNVSKEGRVAIFSLEMTKEQLTSRILSSESNVKMSSIKRGDITDEEVNKIAIASAKLSKRNMYIYDGQAITASEVRATCKKLKIKGGLDVVIIDYIQIMKGEGRNDNKNNEIGAISVALKNLAKELKVTVIALSQLSRACEHRPDHRPMLSDLRESGNLEQDADIVGFLYRDEYYYDEADTERGCCEVIIQKNRNGETGMIKLGWDADHQRFYDI